MSARWTPHRNNRVPSQWWLATGRHPLAPSMDHGGGYLLFVRDGTLLAQPFDSRRMELKGQASVLAERVNDNSVGSAGGHGAFSASANDVLVFQPRATRDRQLTWYDRAAKVLGTVGEPGLYLKVALSPDGSRAALSKGFGLAANIWLQDLSRGATTRFTFGPTTEASFVWSPDGNRIIFNSDRDGPHGLVSKAGERRGKRGGSAEIQRGQVPHQLVELTDVSCCNCGRSESPENDDGHLGASIGGSQEAGPVPDHGVQPGERSVLSGRPFGGLRLG